MRFIAVLAFIIAFSSIAVGSRRHLKAAPKDKHLDLLQNDFSSVCHSPMGSNSNIDLHSHPEISSKTYSTILNLIGPNDPFMLMNPNHKKAFKLLVDIFKNAKDSKSMLKTASFLKQHGGKLNRKLWIHAFITASMTRKDLRALKRPHLMSMMPDSFINKEALMNHINQTKVPRDQRACVPIDGSVGVDNGEENALWYFREDLLNNAQHIFWHMLHHGGFGGDGSVFDRNGELFYYFHRNVMARYDAERYSNGFSRTVAVKFEEGEVITTPYDPHMMDMPSFGEYLPRPANTTLSNLGIMPQVKQTVLDDINARRVIAANGSQVSLNNTLGIDIIGGLLEASSKNINVERYTEAGLHNDGHLQIGMLSPGIDIENGKISAMINPSTSMRDPTFYNWHKLVDDIYHLQNSLLIPHTPSGGEFPLVWSGISVDSMIVESETAAPVTNQLRTRMNKVTVAIPLLGDIFPTPDDELIEYCITRLENIPFNYKININRSDTVADERATLRIFMAPRFNELGQRFSFDEQRSLFFPMDAFTVNLTSGLNSITRRSNESNLLLKWKLESWMENTPDPDVPNCGCGWPHHLMLPKGTSEGMAFDLFVMVTEGLADNTSSFSGVGRADDGCETSLILCGQSFGEPHPDRKPMGYPFDRKPFEKDNGMAVETLEEFVQFVPNSFSTEITILHEI